MPTREEMREAFSKLCRQGYEAWRADMIARGYEPSVLSELKFSQTYGWDNSSWSGWVKYGRLPRDIRNLNALADCPYIGEQVYVAVGLMPDIDDPELRKIVRIWAHLDRPTRDNLFKLFMEHNHSGGKLLDQTT